MCWVDGRCPRWSRPVTRSLRSCGRRPRPRSCGRWARHPPRSISSTPTGCGLPSWVTTRCATSRRTSRRWRMAANPRSWEENSRIRSEGSRNLVDAALAAGATTYVQESIAFLYGEHGDDWVDASTTPIVDRAPTRPVRAAEAEAARFAAAGGRGVVLRFGGFVASDSDQTLAILRAARRGLAVEPGRPDAWFPAVAADDAATAVAAALAAPSGTYDVVDDEPMRRRDARSALAAAVGRRRLHAMPSAKRVIGLLADSQRGLEPAFPGGDGLGAARREPPRGVAGDGAGGRYRARAHGSGPVVALAAGAGQPRRRAPGDLHAPFVLRRLSRRSGLGGDGRPVQPASRARCRLAQSGVGRARVRGARDRHAHDGAHRR